MKTTFSFSYVFVIVDGTESGHETRTFSNDHDPVEEGGEVQNEHSDEEADGDHDEDEVDDHSTNENDHDNNDDKDGDEDEHGHSDEGDDTAHGDDETEDRNGIEHGHDEVGQDNKADHCDECHHENHEKEKEVWNKRIHKFEGEGKHQICEATVEVQFFRWTWCHSNFFDKGVC